MDRRNSLAHLEHDLEYAAAVEQSGKLRQGHAQGNRRDDVLNDRVAQDEVEGCVRVWQGPAEVRKGDPPGDLGMQPAGLFDVFLHHVDAVDVVASVQVHEDVAGAGATACVQTTGPVRHQLLHSLHEVPVPLEPRMG